MALQKTVIFLLFIATINALKLKKVLIISRHNIRAPLFDQLDDYTPKTWPSWAEKPGHLTSKGELMETYIGEYFSAWFRHNNLIEDCPNPKKTIIFANTPQRTVQTAKMFADSAFYNCSINVKYIKGLKTHDPVFKLDIHNNSVVFEEIVVKAMNAKLDEFNLTEQYKMLNEILELHKSKACLEDSFCDLNEEIVGSVAKVNSQPNVEGPLFIANKIVDSFIMQYYNNTPIDGIAWGAINESDLVNLAKVAEADIAVRFSTKIVAEHVSKSLLKYMAGILTNDDINLAVLFGHDSTLESVIAAYDIKAFQLTNQFEVTPIGGKIVFQKWYDDVIDEDLLKIEYIYPSKDQLREGERLSWETPPQIATLEIEGCKIYEEGYCSWSDFENIFGRYL